MPATENIGPAGDYILEQLEFVPPGNGDTQRGQNAGIGAEVLVMEGADLSGSEAQPITPVSDGRSPVVAGG